MENRLNKIRTKLTIKHPYFAVILLGLNLEITDQVKTAAVDGVTLYVNPDFAGSLPDSQLEGLIVHELLHVALKHHIRVHALGDNVDLKLFNQAADYAVNPRVLAAGYQLPDGGLYREEWKDKPTEAIYRALVNEQKKQDQQGDQGQNGQQGQNQQPQQGQNGQGQQDQNGQPDQNQQGQQGKPGKPGEGQSWGEVLPAPTNNPAELADMETQQEIKNQQAQTAQRKREQADEMAGKSGASLLRALGKINPPETTSWRDLLREYLTANDRTGYTWDRPNRRHRDVYLPSRRSRTAAGLIAIAVDVSGSVRNDLLQTFANELGAILDEIRPDKTVVYFCNTSVTGRNEFQQDEPFELGNVRGGGGTRFTPVFNAIEADGEQPELLIYFTDLKCRDYPEQEPDYPTLWAAYDTNSRWTDVPFGDVVLLDEGAA